MPLRNGMGERYQTYSRDCQKLFSEHLLACDDLEQRVKNELASSRSTPTRKVKCERYHTYSRDCQKLFSEHLLTPFCGNINLEQRVKNELASSRSTPTHNVMGERYHRVQSAMKKCREHHSKSFPTMISTISNRNVDDGVMGNEGLAFVLQHRDNNLEQRVKIELASARSTPMRNVMGERYHSKSFPTIKDVSPKENATSTLEGNEVNKARNFSCCSDSLKELFIAMKLEGAIVQTAFGPGGSFRVGSKVGTNGSFSVSSRKHTDLKALSAQEKEMRVLRLLRMLSSAAYFSSRPTIKVAKSVFTVLMVLLTAIVTFLFPKSDIEALNDKRNSRVQRTTNIQEDDFEIWYDFEESLSLFFYYLLHFTFFVISLPACYYLHFF